MGQGFKQKALSLPHLKKERLRLVVTRSHKARTDDFCVSVKEEVKSSQYYTFTFLFNDVCGLH